MILGHLWKVPVILLSTSSLCPWMYDTIGVPGNPVYNPSNMGLTPEGNGFWARLYNTFMFNYIKFGYWYYSGNQDELLRKYFGPDVPSIRELEQNASLVLINNYFPVNGVKPTTAGLVEVGGLHIQNDGPELSGVSKWK